MRRNFRLAGYFLALAIVLGSLVVGPRAWATPNQTPTSQTVPTRTPKPAEPPTAVPPTAAPPTAAPATAVPPTAAPPPTSARAPTATQRPATASQTPAPTATARSAALSLTLSASPILVWSGVTVAYTLTTVNRSAAALRDVALLVELPADLQTVTIIAPKGTAWQGSALRVTLPELAAGASAEVVFTAKVAPGAAAGKIITSRASGSAANVTTVTTTVGVAMPPAELPRFGGAD